MDKHTTNASDVLMREIRRYQDIYCSEQTAEIVEIISALQAAHERLTGTRVKNVH